MAANTKYQPAPTRDSFDEPGYAQPPPSYQAEDSQSALLGAARSEDDNVPDDFKFGGMVSEATLDIRMAFIRKVYAILYVHHFSTPRSKHLLTATQDHPTPLHRRPQLCLLLQQELQELDPKQPVDAMGLPLWRHRIYAPHVLEAKVLPHKPDIPCWIYGTGGIQYFGRHQLLRQQDRG